MYSLLSYKHRKTTISEIWREREKERERERDRREIYREIDRERGEERREREGKERKYQW